MTDGEIHDLIQRSIQGDEKAFTSLVKHFQPFVFSLAFRLVCSNDDAKDAVQASFVKTWKHLGSYDHRRKFSTWMYAIVSNTCMDMLRARKRTSAVVESINKHDGISELPDATAFEEHHSNAELAAIIMQLTSRLSKKQHLVFTLRDLQDLSIAEVVEVSGLSEASVKTNLVFARRHIRELLDRLYHVKER